MCLAFRVGDAGLGLRFNIGLGGLGFRVWGLGFLGLGFRA